MSAQNPNAPIVRTELFIQASSTDFQIPGDMSIEVVKTTYAASIPGLSNMEATETIEYRAELGGNVRMITFRPRQGTKGRF